MSTVKEIAKKLQQKYPNAFIGIGSDFINTQCGIYSISVDGVTRYIGETSRPFYKRFNEHWEMIFKPNDPQYSYMRIYKYLHSCYETGAVIQMQPIEVYNIKDISKEYLDEREKYWISQFPKDQLKQYCGICADYNYKPKIKK